jgi:hypothetical protein
MFIWPKMQEEVARFIKGCILCCTIKPSKKKQGLYSPLLVPMSPWESMSMDFVGGLLRTRRGHEYMYVVVDRFNKMCALMAHKKTIQGQEVASLFFERV